MCDASRPVTGEVTDVLLAECPVQPSIVTSITAEVQVLPPSSQFMLFGFQLWDARNNRWRLVDAALYLRKPVTPTSLLSWKPLLDLERPKGT